MKTLLIVLFFFYNIVSAQTPTAPASGDGSSGNPYQIATLENLYWITASTAEVPSPWQYSRFGCHYIQTADIDASSTSSWFSGAGWIPIGDINGYPFYGTYNGQGHTINNLFINRAAGYQGLFGYVENAVIQNLGITNANIIGQMNVGALLGRDAGNTSISNCYSTGIVTGTSAYSYTGGLVGYNVGNVTNS
jgi:hypothetical protein